MWFFLLGRRRRQGYYLLAVFFTSDAVTCDQASALSQIGTT
jgi:hypothetical protein